MEVNISEAWPDKPYSEKLGPAIRGKVIRVRPNTIDSFHSYLRMGT